jgi:MFS family permease
VQTTAAPSSLNPFIRYRITWLAYGFLAYMTFMPSALGPLMPYIREEMNLSYTLGALHMSVMAVGVIISGMVADRLMGFLGRRRLLWIAIAASFVGTFGMMASRVIYLTLPFALLMGISGSSMLVTVQAVLSDVHGARRTVALTEANVAASLSSLLAPLWASLFLRLGFSWRLALGTALVGLVVIAFVLKGTQVAENGPVEQGVAVNRKGLPGLFWACWLVVVLVVAVEWCLIFWSADYLEKVVGLARVDAVGIVSVFFLAMLVGRMGGSVLSRRYKTVSILLLALALTAAGFPLFWLGTQPGINIGGLFIAGIGVANLFPLAMSAAIGLASDQVNQASSRVTLGSGSAIFAAPLVLGWLADQMTIQRAYAIVIPLLVVAILTVWLLRKRLA